MATLRVPKTKDEISRLGIRNIKENYNQLAEDYIKMYDGEYLLCPRCNEWIKESGFYSDSRNKTGRFHLCKRCVLKMVEQRKRDSDPPNETKQSVQQVLQMMDKVYDDKFYEQCVKGAADDVGERAKPSPFGVYLTSVSSLPQWKGKTWKDSTFGDMEESVDENEIRIIQKTVKAAKKRFGSDYSEEDLMFLENEYQDWVTRYECNTKAQEEVFESLSLAKLLKRKALSKGESTKDIDSQIQNWMNAGNLQPRQNTFDTNSDAQTFGTLIQKWEEERPIPECDPELADVDKIGLYIDVFFKGHTSKMLGLKNTFSHIYENFMKKYTVTPPNYEDEQDSEEVFEKVFGSSIDG